MPENNFNPERILPEGEPIPATHPSVPSPQAQQWGVVISIVIIVLMITVGAFYAWGERISQNAAPGELTASTTLY